MKITPNNEMPDEVVFDAETGLHYLNGEPYATRMTTLEEMKESALRIMKLNESSKD